MKIKNAVTTVERQLETAMSSLEEPLTSVVEFIKTHKKVIISLAILYLAYKYLFDEE